MVDYQELVGALARWRADNGLGRVGHVDLGQSPWLEAAEQPIRRQVPRRAAQANVAEFAPAPFVEELGESQIHEIPDSDASAFEGLEETPIEGYPGSDGGAHYGAVPVADIELYSIDEVGEEPTSLENQHAQMYPAIGDAMTDDGATVVAVERSNTEGLEIDIDDVLAEEPDPS